MNSNRPSKPNLPNVLKPSKLLAPTRLHQTYFFSSFPDSATWSQHQPMWNWFLHNCFAKHQTALSQKWIWWEKVLVMKTPIVLVGFLHLLHSRLGHMCILSRFFKKRIIILLKTGCILFFFNIQLLHNSHGFFITMFPKFLHKQIQVLRHSSHQNQNLKSLSH